MTWRALLIGDIHLRAGEHLEDSVDCLDWAANLANEHNCSAVLLAGDVYEGRSTVVERRAASDALLALSGLGVRPVIVCRGNHDQLGDLEVFSGYPGVHVCETPRIITLTEFGSSIDVLGVPWPERAFLAASGYAGEDADQAGSAALAAMLRAMVASREHPERPLVVLAHLQVLGAVSSSAQPLIGKAIEAVLGDLQDFGAAAVVLGHVHKPQQLAPGIEYVGSLTCHDFGEEAEQKRVGLLEIGDDGAVSWEWVPVPCRRWYTVEASVTDGCVGEAGDFLAGDIPGSCIRYRYRCDESEQHLFDHAAIECRFAAAHSLKIVPEVTRASAARAGAEDVAAAKTVEEKLRAWGVAAAVEITPRTIEKLRLLEGEASHV